MRILKIITNILLALYVSNAVACCKSIHTSIETKASSIIASINLVDIIDDKVKVEIKINSLDNDTISYYLPKIVPGTYQNNNYGKYIEDFKAFDKQGKALTRPDMNSTKRMPLVFLRHRLTHAYIPCLNGCISSRLLS